MNSKNIIWEKPDCNNCGSKKYKILWRDVGNWEFPEKFRIVKCAFCGLSFLNPRPKKQFINNYYSRKSYWGIDLGNIISHPSRNWRQQRESDYGNLYNRIFKEKTQGSVLDIGAGTGVFLSKFKEKGWDISGVEYSQDATNYAERVFGLNIKRGGFLDYSFKRDIYDVVVLNNVLEHLYFPKETLRKTHLILKKNGLLVVTVPNLNSIGSDLFGKHWYPLQPPIHLYHFTYQSLSSMLSSVGFRIVSSDHSFWVHNYYSLFQSFRFLVSPKYKDNHNKKFVLGGKMSPNSESIIKEAGKIFFSLISRGIAFIEPFINKGEVITIYAKRDEIV